MESIDELYINHLKEVLNPKLPDGYDLNIEWYVDFFPKIKNSPILNSKTLNIVLQKFPSLNYAGVVMQSVNLVCLVDNESVDIAMNLLSYLQISTNNVKTYLNKYMLIEKYDSPTIDQNFIPIGITNGTQISLTGTISFDKSALDVESVLIDNEKIDILDGNESFVCQPLSQQSVNVSEIDFKNQRVINQSASYQLTIKVKNTNNNFCKKLRDLKNEEISINSLFSIKLIYNDLWELSKERKMKVSSIISTFNNSSLNQLTITFNEAEEDEEV